MMAHFNGTDEERKRLLLALQRNCECSFDECGSVIQECAAHAMWDHDQRALDGLLMERRRFIKRIEQEHMPTP